MDINLHVDIQDILLKNSRQKHQSWLDPDFTNINASNYLIFFSFTTEITTFFILD